MLFICKRISSTLQTNWTVLSLQRFLSTQTNWVFNEIRGLVENLPSCQLKGRTIDGLNGIRVTETSLL
jgi:hypothetical protein